MHVALQERSAQQALTMENRAPDIDQAIELTAQGFVRPIDEELRQDVRDHLETGDSFYTVTKNNEEVAYAIFCNYQSPAGKILYLSGVIVEEGHQRQGVSEYIVQQAIVDEAPDYLVFRTQSARMYAAGQKMVNELYPKLDSEDMPFDVRLVGLSVAAAQNSEFPVTKKCYGGKPLYGQRPTHPNHAAFYELCSFAEGDAVLCVGRLALSAEH